MPTDFVALYDLLGVGADCSAAEFKQAFRRLISERHPDRNGGDASAGDVPEIIAAYNAALAFHRRHGRLPGAAQRRPPRRPPGAVASARLDRQGSTASLPARSPRRVVLIFLLGVAALLLIDGYFGDDAATLRPDGLDDSERPTLTSSRLTSGAPPFAATQAVTPAATVVELGLDMDTVLAIEGRPVARSETRWDYGPSWIEFENGRVSDWQSSPLHPLQVASARPR